MSTLRPPGLVYSRCLSDIDSHFFSWTAATDLHPNFSIRQSDIILRQRRLRGGRFEKIFKFGGLDLLIEPARFGDEMQQIRHLPGKAFGLPDSRQRVLRIGVKPGV